MGQARRGSLEDGRGASTSTLERIPATTDSSRSAQREALAEAKSRREYERRAAKRRQRLDRRPPPAPRAQATAKHRHAQHRRARPVGRSRLALLMGAPLCGVLAMVLAVVVGISTTGRTDHVAAAEPRPVATELVKAISAIPASTYDVIGAGTIRTAPTSLPDAALLANGKPKILYIGAEYCPNCAAERWALIAALSRFGSFSGLTEIRSSRTDLFPNTASVSFHGATYTSALLSFTGIEAADTTGRRLDTPTVADQARYGKDDNGAGLPFIDFGNKFAVLGASFDPGVLAGLTHAQIAAALADPSSPTALAIDGTANVMTAALCQLTRAKPVAVCSSRGVKAGVARLPSAQ